MRYAAEHKDETRTKVLRAAATAMRVHGPDGVGVADIMRSVGLTHGGFYAHFRNKDDLVAQAVTQMFFDAGGKWDRATANLPRAQALATFIDRYVSARHRDDVSRGCPLTSVAMDLSRQTGDARAAFDRGVAGLLTRLENWLPQDAADAKQHAVSLLAEMVGAVALARAVSDPALSDTILTDARRSVRRHAGLPDTHVGDAA
jgi:TetR/AcrR family transcriptional repressor of nem operon